MLEEWAGEGVTDAMVDSLELVIQGVELIGVGVEEVGLGLEISTSLSFGSVKLSSRSIEELTGDTEFLLSCSTNESKVGSIMLKE